jgi:hypothetical protein
VVALISSVLNGFTAIPGKIKAYALIAATVAAALFAAYIEGRSSGANNAKKKEAEDSLDASRKARKVENEVVSKSPDAVRRELGDKWMRD